MCFCISVHPQQMCSAALHRCSTVESLTSSVKMTLPARKWLRSLMLSLQICTPSVSLCLSVTTCSGDGHTEVWYQLSRLHSHHHHHILISMTLCISASEHNSSSFLFIFNAQPQSPASEMTSWMNVLLQCDNFYWSTVPCISSLLCAMADE